MIPVTHVNVRLSISFLVLKLITADVLVTVLLAILYVALVPTNLISSIHLTTPANTLLVFIVLTFGETILTIYIIMQWLSEYYEISPYAVTHKRGVLFKKADRYNMQNIKQMKVEQGVVGKLLNYGTVVLFDWRLSKYAELYAVHNPMRYTKILEKLLPFIDEQKSILREHILESDDDWTDSTG
jgi:membrane protein YdbS with pleckstrin-like domain